MNGWVQVENGNVPVVLLVCRNSTDTAYFQRLRPYPRVLLRRSFTLFKVMPHILHHCLTVHLRLTAQAA